jgi:hypothetical protein
MLVYKKTKAMFIRDMDEQSVPDQIIEGFKKNGLMPPSKGEVLSWRNSLMFMLTLLNHPALPDECGVAIEYCIPFSGKRVDFIITGLTGSGDQPGQAAVIIELKQWESLEVAGNLNEVVRVRTFVGGRLGEHPHPSYQAWSYAQLIEKFNEAVEVHRIDLHPCAFLHNYKKVANDPLLDRRYSECLRQAPAFCHGEIPKLREFIGQRIMRPDQGRVLSEIESGRIRPAKSLQDALAGLLAGNPEFIMVDDQKVVFEKARSLALESKAAKAKRVVIVRGGPGTGKSVVAVNLLVSLTREELVCKYVSKNSAPRNVYASRLIGSNYRKAYINGLFCGSGGFYDLKANFFDALIVDEAHRLNEKSGIYGNLGENQTMELINAARFTVFFIDEAQRVTLRDAGSIQEIGKWAERAGAEVTILDLTSQFRCNGSREYIAWLDDVLGIPPSDPEALLSQSFNYEIRVFDDPNEMAAAIEERNKRNNRSRLLAGYCWNWITKGKNNPEHMDIVIPEWGFARSWNLASTATWAIDAESAEQVGCVHTSQGLEFDYVGVIIGDDLRYEAGKVITDPSRRARTDQSLSGLKKLAQSDPAMAKGMGDEIIRNTYRVLLTRGQLGCYVFCTDKALGEYLKHRAESLAGTEQTNAVLITPGNALKG